MDARISVFVLGLFLGFAHTQSAVPVSFQGVDKNEPLPIQGTDVKVTPIDGPPPTGGGVKTSATEVGGIPVGQFSVAKTKTPEGVMGGAKQLEVGLALDTPLGTQTDASFTPMGLTGTGTTWAEALGYAPKGWESNPPQGQNTQTAIGWNNQATPSNTPQATPIDTTPLSGVARGGAGLLDGMFGGDMGGLFGGIGGASGAPGLLNSGGLLGGVGGGRGVGSFGGGSEGLLVGLGMGGGSEGLLGGLGGLLGGSGGGLFGGMNGLLGGSSRRSSGGMGNRSSRQGEMLRTMLLMQVMGGGDAPDPPANAAGRRGRPAMISPIEQLLRLEQINAIRQRQIDRAMRNRMRPENQRRGWDSYQSNSRSFEAPRTFGPPGRDASGWSQSQSEPLGRHTVPSRATPPPNRQGQAPQPIGREPAPFQSQPQGFRGRQQQFQRSIPPPDPSYEMSPNPSPTEFPPVQSTPPRFNRLRQRDPIHGRPAVQGLRRTVQIPRNVRELMANHRFQRQMRLRAKPAPGSNPADVRADRADLMADYMDNLQSVSPLQRMMQSMGIGSGGMPGLAGLSGLSGIPGLGGGMMELSGLLGGGNTGTGGIGPIGRSPPPNSQLLQGVAGSEQIRGELRGGARNGARGGTGMGMAASGEGARVA